MDEIHEILKELSFADAYWVLLIPCALMALDVLTGVIQAWSSGHIKSYRMREGLGRKFGEVTILIIGGLFTIGLNIPSYIMAGFSLYIIIMELISLCENLDKMGVKIPKFIKKALGEINEEIQNGSKDEKEGGDK